MLSDALFLLLISLGVSIIFLTCMAMYFLPSIIAFIRNHPHRIAILILNLITGATVVGWIASFIWAFIDKHAIKLENKPTTAQEIKELAQLKDQGIITEEEFEAKKKNLLDL